MKAAHQILPALMRKQPQRAARSAAVEEFPAEELVRAAWEHLAGKHLAARTRPQRIYRGRLIVEVPERSWPRHLRRYENVLKDRVNNLLGENRVDDIEWHVNPELAAAPPRKPPSRQAEAADPALAAAAQAIGDPELRELFLRTAMKFAR